MLDAVSQLSRTPQTSSYSGTGKEQARSVQAPQPAFKVAIRVLDAHAAQGAAPARAAERTERASLAPPPATARPTTQEPATSVAAVSPRTRGELAQVLNDVKASVKARGQGVTRRGESAVQQAETARRERAQRPSFEVTLRPGVDALSRQDASVRAAVARNPTGGAYGQRGVDVVTSRGPDGQYYATSARTTYNLQMDPSRPEDAVRRAVAIRQQALSSGRPGGPDQAAAKAANQLAAGAIREILNQATPSQVPAMNREPVELPPALANMLRDKPAPPPVFLEERADLRSIMDTIDRALGSEAPRAENQPI